MADNVQWFVSSLVEDMAYNLQANLVPWCMYVVAWFALHGFLQYAVPAVFPSVYDALGRKEGTTNRAKLAADGRTKGMCLVMSLYVTLAAIYVMLQPEARAMWDDLYSSTPVTRHLVTVTSAYFFWDIVICIIDRESAAFHFHAWAAFILFTCAMRPFVHYMAMIALMYEASTPFLHIRKIMIQARTTDNVAYTVVTYSFGLVFLFVRLILGNAMLLQWGPLTLDHMRKKLVHNDAVAYIFMFLSFSLTCLNVFWFSQMVRIMLSPGKKRPAKKDTTKKGDASGTLSPSVDELRLKSA